MRVRRARLVAGLLAAAALVLGAASPGETFFRCRFDHIARPTCCCDESRSADDRAGMATSDCGCCDVETYKIVQPTPGTRLHQTERPPASYAILPLPIADRALVVVAPPTRIDQRERNGPPIVVLTHSFRI